MTDGRSSFLGSLPGFGPAWDHPVGEQTGNVATVYCSDDEPRTHFSGSRCSVPVILKRPLPAVAPRGGRGARDTHRAQDGPRQHALPRCQEAGSGRSRSARPGPAPASCSFTVAAVFLSFPIRRLRHAHLCIRSLPTACGEPDWEAPDLRQASCEREVRFECADSVSVPTAHTVLTSPKALHTRQTAARRKQDWGPKHSCDSLCCATYCTAVVRNRTPTCLGAAWVEMGARHHTSARTRTAQRPERTAARGPGVASMCGCRSVSRDKRPALEGDVNSGVAVPVWGKGCAADLSSTMNLKLP